MKTVTGGTEEYFSAIEFSNCTWNVNLKKSQTVYFYRILYILDPPFLTLYFKMISTALTYALQLLYTLLMLNN